MHKKPRLPRIERSEHDGIEDETAHLWAVSYSDFLMVLLSFFILFFSVDKDEKESVIQRLLQTSLEEVPQSSRQPTSSETDGPEFKSNEKDRFSASAIRSALAGFRLKKLEDKETLMLLFPDNLYPSLGINLSGQHLAQFETILLRLKPFMDEIEITIVGHADRGRLREESKKGVLENNFDLSVMRAAKALQRAIGLGMRPEILSAQGAAANERDARSISLVIRPKRQK